MTYHPSAVCTEQGRALDRSSSRGRHIGVFLDKAEAAGKPLPISISIGVDPAIYIGTCFEAPTTPLGFDELSIAGRVRKRPVELVECVSVKGLAIANAEVVIEGKSRPRCACGGSEYEHRKGDAGVSWLQRFGLPFIGGRQG